MRLTLRVRALRTMAVVTSVGFAACGDLSVFESNNPSIEDLVTRPTVATIQSAALGILAGWRGTESSRFGHGDVGFATGLTTFGREAWEIQPANPSLLRGRVLSAQGLSTRTPEFFWYSNIRTIFSLLKAVDAVAAMSETDREATRGWAKTVLAVEFLRLIATRDTFGIPLDVDRDPLGEPPPIAPKNEVYQRIFQLFDEAKTHLQNGGSNFPFRLTSGFAGFDAPSTFIRVNRSLKARAQVYFNDWNGALTSLGESFLSTAAPLNLGAYHVFTANSGDQTNPLISVYANDRILTEAQLRLDGTRDLRATTKVVSVPPASLSGVTVSLAPAMYRSPTAPLVIIKNEELILLRAEANLGLGNRGAALADINFIRTSSGGLAPIADPGGSALLDELLYNKRYSLWFEWGHVWLDMRHYGRIAQIPRHSPEFLLFDVHPFPITECEERNPQPRGCVVVSGF